MDLDLQDEGVHVGVDESVCAALGVFSDEGPVTVDLIGSISEGDMTKVCSI